MSNRESIKSFCDYFNEQFSQIVLVDNRLYQKILLVTAIDALSRATHGALELKPKRRFVNFVCNFANWKDKDRVSLVQLSHRLPLLPSKLKDHVDEQLRNWKHSQIYGIDNDPFASDLEALATVVERQRIEDCCHGNLLYEYRCNLVHEFRESGHGSERDNDHSPFYHILINFDGPTESRDTWELVYPVTFFINLAKLSLDNLRQHLFQNDIDPYSFYKFGTLWKHN